MKLNKALILYDNFKIILLVAILLQFFTLRAWSQKIDSLDLKNYGVEEVAKNVLFKIIHNNLDSESLRQVFSQEIGYDGEKLFLTGKEIGKLLFREGRYRDSKLFLEFTIEKSDCENNLDNCCELLLEYARACLYNNKYNKSKKLLDSVLYLSSSNIVAIETIVYLRDVYSEYYLIQKNFKYAKIQIEIADSLSCELLNTSAAYQRHLKFSIYVKSLTNQFEEALELNSKLLLSSNSQNESLADLFYNQSYFNYKLGRIDSAEYYCVLSNNYYLQKYPKNSISIMNNLNYYAIILTVLKKYDTAFRIYSDIDASLNDKFIDGVNEFNKDYLDLYILNTSKLAQLGFKLQNYSIVNKISLLDSLVANHIIDSLLGYNTKVIVYDFLFMYYSKSRSERYEYYFKKLSNLYLNSLESAVEELSDNELRNFLINKNIEGINTLFSYYNSGFMSSDYTKYLFWISLLNKGIGIRRNDFNIRYSDDYIDSLKNLLGENEIAVNFFKYNRVVDYNFEVREEYYVALVLNKFDNPKVIEISSENKLDSIINYSESNSSILLVDNIVRSSSFGLVKRTKSQLEILYNIIWKPILSQYKSTTRVYYSSTGILNKVNLSILQKSKDVYSNDEIDYYNMLHLSSFPSIFKNNLKSLNKALVVGGVDYGDPQVDQESTWSELSASKEEVLGINDILLKTHVSCDLFMGRNADKKTIISKLTSNQYNIVHISTHGFYLEELNDSKNVLNHTGIVLSGANYHTDILNSQSTITSSDLQNINLNSTLLFVLSSCNSGSGKLTQNNEGTYGFQWVLKKAGVEKILISLWPVPDIPTMKLLKEFYENIIIHKIEPNLALKLAQNKTKLQFPDYYSWAGFVLLN